MIVAPVVVAFHVLDDLFHFCGLPLPLVGCHLCVAPEELVVRLAVAAAEAIPERCELAVVVVEVKMVP